MTDASGGLILKLDGLNQPVRIGQQVRLTGAATVRRSGNVFQLGVDGLVVDNDGVHWLLPPTERTGVAFLKAGQLPIQVQWFNRHAAFRQPVTTAAAMEGLTPSEKKIIELLAQGLPNKEIANRLGLSVTTVSWHLENIYLKLRVKSRTEAVLKFHSTKAPQTDKA